MKKRIVINVPMHNGKAKSKAMKIAVAVHGVMSVRVGEESDRLEVVGEGVDSVSLARSLRKRFSFAYIISLDEAKPAGPEAKSSPPPSHYYPPPPYWPPVYYSI